MFLSACSLNSKQGQEIGSALSDGRTFQDEQQKYVVTIPSDFPRWTTLSKGLDGPSHPYFTTSETQSETSTITIFSPPSSCSPSLTGTYDKNDMPNTGGKTTWGRFRDDEMTEIPELRIYNDIIPLIEKVVHILTSGKKKEVNE